MANPEQVAKVQEGADAWNVWRANQLAAAALDLSGVDFSGKDLSGANLRLVGLSHANFLGADLRDVNFGEANLSGASLREANLQRVDLSAAKRGLQTEQLAGADLTGAKLPDELTKLYDKLENVNNISESARKLFLAVLAACLYSWLTIATTTDVNLITNRASSPLPIIQTSIPIVGFYWVAPLLLLCVYFYFHFYLQKLWEELGSLPAIFPDGRPLHAKIDPWLLNDLVRAHLPKLNVNRPFLSYFQLWISVLLAWWVVPFTIFLFWGRYLPRQERTGTTFHVVVLAVAVMAAPLLHRLGVATLRGSERRAFRWKRVLASRRGWKALGLGLAVGTLFAAVSWGARWGIPSNATILGLPPRLLRRDQGSRTGPPTWVPRLMAVVGYSPFANLEGAELSQKKPTWSPSDTNFDSVSPFVLLPGVNLRYAQADGAFLAGAKLYKADLRGADLSGADLRGAYLHTADLRGSRLIHANLDGAVLYDAFLAGADLDQANLRGAGVDPANFTDVKNLDLAALRETWDWQKGRYDDGKLNQLFKKDTKKVEEDTEKKEHQPTSY